MTDTAAILTSIALLTCIAVIDANFGGNGSLFNGCVTGMFFGALIEGNIERKE